MTIVEREEMERVAKFLEENPNKCGWQAIQGALGLTLDDDWPALLEKSYLEAFLIATDDGQAMRVSFLAIVRDLLRTEPAT